MLYLPPPSRCATSAHSGHRATNPWAIYNGFKMVMAGRAIYGDDIQAIRAMMDGETWSSRMAARAHRGRDAGYCAHVSADIAGAAMKTSSHCGTALPARRRPDISAPSAAK
jgi:phosphomannomutase